MSQLKKFLGIKKKSRSIDNVSSGSIATAGYVKVKEKELPKLLKAAWVGDLAKLKTITSKSGKKAEDVNQMDKQNRTALHLACARGNTRIVSHLLESKAKTNLCDNEGKTPLVKAIECGEKECINVLLEYGADPNVIDVHGRSALHVCADTGRVDVGTALVERDARLDAKDKNGRTPLHVVTEAQNHDFARLLLDEGAPVDAVDGNGRTALIIAASNGFIALVRLLVNYKADGRVKDSQGYRAADYALMKGHTHVSETLRGFESQTLSAPGSRRPSASLAGSLRSNVGGGGGAGLLTLGAPALDRGEEPSAMTGDESRDGSRASLKSWMSSDDESFAQDNAAAEKKPNVASHLFGNGQAKIETEDLQPKKSLQALPPKESTAKPTPWESVNIGGSSEEENGERWTTSKTTVTLFTSPPKISVNQSFDDDFESDDDDDIDAQVNAALSGTKTHSIERESANVSEKKFPQAATASNVQRTSAGQGLGINYGDADDDLLESSVQISDGDDDDAASDLIKNRGKEQTAGQAERSTVNGHKKEQETEEKGDNNSDDDWDSDDDVDDDDDGVSNALAGLGGGSLSAAFRTPFFQKDKSVDNDDDVDDDDDDDDDDEIEMMAAPAKDVQPPRVAKADEKKDVNGAPPKQDVTAKKFQPIARNFGSMIGPEDGDEDDDDFGSDNDDDDDEVEKKIIEKLEREPEERIEKKDRVLENESPTENDDTFTEEPASEWEEEEKRRRQIDEQKAAKRGGPGSAASLLSEETATVVQRTKEWQKENAEAELERLKEAEELKRLEAEENSWDEEGNSILDDLLGDGGGDGESPNFARSESSLLSDERAPVHEMSVQLRVTSNSSFGSAGLEQALADVRERQATVEEETALAAQEEQWKIEREKELRRLADAEKERRRQKDEEIAEEEARLAEVKRQRETENAKREKELAEKREREERERKRRVEEEERVAEEAKRRRLEEEARVREMEERVRQRQDELRAMEDEARRRREADEARWRDEREARRKEELRLAEEAAKQRQAEEERYAAEQEKRRRDEETRRQRRVEEQERLLVEERERRRVADAKRVEVERERHDEEMKFWRDEQEKRAKETAERLARERDREEALKQANYAAVAEIEKTSFATNRDDELDDALGLVSSGRGLPSGLSGVPARSGDREDDSTRSDVKEAYSGDVSLKSDYERELVGGSDGENGVGESESSHSLRSTVLPLDASQKAFGQGLRSSSRQSFLASSPLLLTDAGAASRLNESLRETKKMLGKANDAKSAAEISKQEMKTELLDLRRKYEEIARVKSTLDQTRLDLELEARSLRYKYEQEQASQQGTAMLLSQMKEQLARAESRLSQESQARREAELGRRNVEIEQRNVQATAQQLESQIAELKLQLVKEREARAQAEVSHVERMKLYQQMQEEAKKAVNQKSFAQSDLQSSNERCLELQKQLHAVQAELQVAKQAIESNERLYKERITLTENEVETLKEKLQDKTEETLNLDKAFIEKRSQFDGNLSDLRSKIVLLDAELDKQRGLKEAIEVEARSLKSRLESAGQDLEQTLVVNRNMEKTFHREQEEWSQQKSALEKDVFQAREAVQSSALQAASLEAKLESAERDLQAVQLQLAERVGQLVVHGKDSESRDKQLMILEEKAKQDRATCSQLTTKLEITTERLTTSQSESSFLRQQLDLANSKIAERDRAAHEGQDKFTTLINSLRSDAEKIKATGEAKQDDLQQKVVQLKENLARTEAEKRGLERDVERLQNELRDGHRKHDMSVGSLERAVELKSSLEDVKSQLEQRLIELESQLEKALSDLQLSQRKVSDLSERLATSELSARELLQKLQSSNEELMLMGQAKADAERQVNAVDGERQRVELALRSEKEKVSALREDLLKAEQFRFRLESKCSDLRHETNELDEQLKEARSAHTLALNEAEEAKGLWETEVKSRSKLGLRLLKLEKNQTEIKTTVDGEKKRTQKALDLKRASDYKVDALQERNAQLQKELGLAKGQLKAAKKRLRNLESEESRLPALKAEFQSEKMVLESNVNALKTQLDETRRQLNEEAERRTIGDSAHGRLVEEIKALRNEAMTRDAKEREQALLRRELQKTNSELEDELRRIKNIVASDYVPKTDADEFKKDIEAEARMELNRRLEDLNTHLVEQSTARENVERMREEKEVKLKNEFDRTTASLRAELQRLRTSLHDGEVQKESAEAEAKRYKTLYEREMHEKESLGSELHYAKREKSHTKAKLHSERRRMKQLADSSSFRFSTADTTKGIPSVLSTAQRSDDILASVRAELDRSVRKHLDADTSTSFPSAPLTVGDLGGDGRLSSSRYLAELKRNYFV